MQNQAYPSNETSASRGISWALIVIVLIVFWPVGIYLLYRKLSVDKKSAMNAGKGVFIAGWVLAAMGLILVIVGPSDPSQAVSGRIMYFVLFVGGGLALILFGNYSRTQAERFRKYIDIVVNRRVDSVGGVAALMNVSEDIVVHNLQKMIGKGYFPGAYLDLNERKLVWPDKRGEEPAGANVKMQICRCKSCGADNTIAVGTVGKCEYCDSPISAS